jgi:hypothetical protein
MSGILHYKILYCVVLYFIEGVVIAAQCIASFSDILCSPEFRYYLDLNMPIKFCSEAYFFRLEVLKQA